ncbi:MAG: hypothetical protein LC122_11840 [Chitinophagales bacterium]|nr:hypothetical protein [Chitinophagales bacterium]
MTKEEAIKLASDKIIPRGYKPEDYYYIREDIPYKIAKAIVIEAKNILINVDKGKR